MQKEDINSLRFEVVKKYNLDLFELAIIVFLKNFENCAATFEKWTGKSLNENTFKEVQDVFSEFSDKCFYANNGRNNCPDWYVLSWKGESKLTYVKRERLKGQKMMQTIEIALKKGGERLNLYVDMGELSYSISFYREISEEVDLLLFFNSLISEIDEIEFK